MNEYKILAPATEIAKRTKTNYVDKQQREEAEPEQETSWTRRRRRRRGTLTKGQSMKSFCHEHKSKQHFLRVPPDATLVRIAVGVSIAIQMWIENERGTVRLVNQAADNWK